MDQNKEIEEIKNEITRLLDEYYLSYRRLDFKAMKELMLTDETLIGIGTDMEEFWLGWDEIKDYLESQLKSILEIDFKVNTRRIKLANSKDVAWFGETLTGTFSLPGEIIELPIRMSGVVQKIGDKWKIVHFHRSVPIKENAVKYKYPVSRVRVRM
jgi:hypothetical protein